MPAAGGCGLLATMSSRPRLAAALVAVFAALLAPSAAGAAVQVTNQNDSGPGSLRQAVADAAAGETVTVPAGTYTLSSEEIALAKSLTIAGAGADQTVIRSGGNFRVLRVSGAGSTLTLSGLTVRDGRLLGGIQRGGGIYAEGTASLVLRGVVVRDNLIDVSGEPGVNGGIAEGGGIAIGSGTLSIADSAIVGNTVRGAGGSGSNGGVIWGGGIAGNGATVTIERSDISGNTLLAPGGQGPSNASQNGGIAEGGGIGMIAVGGPMTVTASTISSNRVDTAGGPGAVNGISQGGGIYFLGGADKALALTATTVAANSVTGTGGSPPTSGVHQGGGIYATVSGTGRIDLVADTIAGNVAETGDGGNLYTAGTTKASGTIVAGGVGAAGKDNCFKAIESGGFNLEGSDECGFKFVSDKVNADPHLGPLQDNGGPGPTLVPEFGSPAIDQGAAFGLSSDERGIKRPIDFPMFPNSTAPGADGSDIGAVEVQPSNAFSFGPLARNRKKGVATIEIDFASVTFGTLTLSGRGLKPRTATIAGEGNHSFWIATKGGIRKQLVKRGRRKVNLTVTFTPGADVNTSSTQTRTVRLVKKAKKAKKKHRPHRKRGGS